MKQTITLLTKTTKTTKIQQNQCKISQNKNQINGKE